jgi:tetratricopeptide (TPR) repeat protein
VLAFALTMTVVVLIDRSSSSPRVSSGEGGIASDVRSADKRITTLEAALRVDPRNVSALASLGAAYLQKVRETADFGFYRRAELAFSRSLAVKPRNPAALVGMGTLALARHDFRAGLRYGRQAHEAAPDVVLPYGVIVDALTELGRFPAAERTLQHMVDLKPNLSSYARVSYLRELHGDLGGALEAMRLAVSAGGQAPENVAYVQTLLGNLQFARGKLSEADRSYRQALASYPRYAAADAGRARVQAWRGDLEGSIHRYRDVTTRLPLPEYLVGLGETELAARRPSAARRDFGTVRIEMRLIGRSGVNTDAELALFEANHGDPGRGVRLARRAWVAAPSVRSADALGWALTAAGHPRAGLAWAHRALRLGSRDPLFLYHAGIAARAAGQRGQARALLSRALEHGPGFSPLHGPRAERALRSLR